jgi:anti-sigma regulatory factor (Ser/Thr protein kinase)
MAMTAAPPIAVQEASQVGGVRRAASDLAIELGFDAEGAARVGLIATEMATNLVKHGRDGVMVLQSAVDAPTCIELLALDRGPGIANIGRALQDGMSTVGSPGSGLGAIRRLAHRFDVYSTTNGTVVYAALAPHSPPRTGFDVGAISVPYPGEQVCGDGVTLRIEDGRAIVLVTDGLGHGPLAAEATATAAALFAKNYNSPPVVLMQRLHDGMRGTRGAAAAVAEVDARRGAVRYCGVGNIAATISTDGATRSLVSHHGTLGHDARRMTEFQYPWTPSSTLVLNSDGLVTNWSLENYPGLSARAPSLVAAVLYRDYRRHRDDTTVLVLRGKA